MKVNCKGCSNDDCSYFGMNNNTICKDYIPLNPAPQQRPSRSDMAWVGLDLDERSACYEKSGGNLSKFADAVEAKLKELNT